MATWCRHLLKKSFSRYARNLQQQSQKSSIAPILEQRDGEEEGQDMGSIRPFEDIPGPKVYSFVGGIPHYFPRGKFYKKEHHEVSWNCKEKYGSIYKECFLPGRYMVHVFEPEAVEQVYRTDGKYPVREAFFTLSHFNKKYNKNTQGLLTSQGESWHHIRKNVQQKMLRPKAVSAYLSEQAIVAKELVDHLKKVRNSNGEIEDVRSDFDKFAAECVGVVCFNTRLGAFTNTALDSDARRFIEAVDIVMDISCQEFKKLPLYLIFNTPSFKRFMKAQQFIKEIALKYSNQALKRLTDSNEEFDGEHADLIPYLLSKTELTEEQVMTVIGEFIFAGVDTTSHHLSFLMYLLGRHPEIQEKLYREIMEHIPADEELNQSNIGKLSYLRAVQKETHRLLPVAPGNVRKIAKEINLCGYNIPAGTTVALHTDWIGKQDKHFPEASKFKPERWIRNSNQASIHPFAFTPFGFGTRSCIGRRFADQESQVALVKLLQRFKIQYIGEEMQIRASITFGPANKVSLKLTKR